MTRCGTTNMENLDEARKSCRRTAGCRVCGGGNALAAELRCDNCSEAQYLAKATSAGVGTQYVYDLVKGQTRKYTAWREPNEMGGTVFEIQSEPVEAQFDLVVLEYSDWYHQTGGTMSKATTLTATGTVGNFTAYDVVGPGPKQQALFDWISNGGSLDSVHNTFSHAVISFTSALKIIMQMPAPVAVTVVFPDGSQITLNYEVVDSTVQAKDGTAKDAHGNIIVLSKDQLNGMTFDYRNDSLGYDRTKMTNWLTGFLGVPVSSSSGIWGYACVSAGGFTSCKIVSIR